MSEKVYGWRRRKNFQNFFCQKFFWSEKNLGLKEEFGLKKTFVGKFFWSGISGVRKSIFYMVFTYYEYNLSAIQWSMYYLEEAILPLIIIDISAYHT